MSDPFDLAAEAFAAFKDTHPGSTIVLSVEEFEAIKKRMGWTDQEAQRWLNDQEPLP